MPRRKRTDPDHPVFAGVPPSERTALMSDYAKICAEKSPDAASEMVKRGGPAVFAAAWITTRRAQSKRKRQAKAEVYAGLSAREHTAMMRDYARAAAEPTPESDVIRSTGPAVFAAVWIVAYRAHQSKRRRARWPDEDRKPETAAEVRARKRAARERKAQAA